MQPSDPFSEPGDGRINNAYQHSVSPLTLIAVVIVLATDSLLKALRIKR